MATEPTANLTFLPWVRQGAATLIGTADTLGAKQQGVIDLNAVLSVNGSATPPVVVRLRGPADVVAIDARQVIRTDPQPGSSNFEPNCFAAIEFDRADFPWLFTPARADANARLRPWLCLVVVRKQDGVAITSGVDSPLSVLKITAPASPAAELPDLRECWAWAHSQAAADAAQVERALNGASALSLARLVPARRRVVKAGHAAGRCCAWPSVWRRSAAPSQTAAPAACARARRAAGRMPEQRFAAASQCSCPRCESAAHAGSRQRPGSVAAAACAG